MLPLVLMNGSHGWLIQSVLICPVSQSRAPNSISEGNVRYLTWNIPDLYQEKSGPGIKPLISQLGVRCTKKTHWNDLKCPKKWPLWFTKRLLSVRDAERNSLVLQLNLSHGNRGQTLYWQKQLVCSRGCQSLISWSGTVNQGDQRPQIYHVDVKHRCQAVWDWSRRYLMLKYILSSNL